jgi:hypothetical protein
VHTTTQFFIDSVPHKQQRRNLTCETGSVNSERVCVSSRRQFLVETAHRHRNKYVNASGMATRSIRRVQSDTRYNLLPSARHVRACYMTDTAVAVAKHLSAPSVTILSQLKPVNGTRLCFLHIQLHILACAAICARVFELLSSLRGFLQSSHTLHIREHAFWG